ncbi:TVG0507890 [Thermoplasma volcanium GSS1]|uniref:TVG0507890 protein n=1 Tax=Thermoplasma volcanium (strain ATCC 51530 / DSM 4299 / JCM 9571 / NBRC 15438 / GSS1) TaxID=273116 RepID=Q97BD8_THEVO|nr:COG1361 S-layer family protein [Thermoplasma volcanium]BAB59660.1 TVG0507890 [Thermoplasma volcanium GSS1]
MRYKYISIILLAAVLLASSSVMPVSYGSTPIVEVSGVSWYTVNSSEVVAPGMTFVPLVVTFVPLANLSSVTAFINVTKYNQGILSYVNTYGYNPGPTEYNFSYLPAGKPVTLVQMVNVNPNASDGLYREALYVSGLYSSIPVFENVSFSVPILGKSSILVLNSFFGTQSNPMAGRSGMRFVPLTVMLENNGNVYTQNVSISYVPQGPIYGYTQNTTLAVIPPGEAVPVTFIVSVKNNATNGVFVQNLSLRYLGAYHNVSFNLQLDGYSELSLTYYFFDPPIVYTNEKFISLKIGIQNSGNTYAKNTSIFITSSDFTVLSHGYNVSYLPSGQFNFTFLINSGSMYGTQEIDIHIGSGVFPILIYVHRVGELFVSYSQTTLQPGVDKSSLYFNITNEGNRTMYDINVHLLYPAILTIHTPSSNPLLALTANNITIARLVPGQSFLVVFVVDTSSAAHSGQYPIQLYASWHYNNTNYLFFKVYDTSVRISPTVEQQLSDFFTFNYVTVAVLAVIVVVVVGIAVYAGVKSRKGNKGR